MSGRSRQCDTIERLRQEAERVAGCRILLRGIKPEDPRFRGCLLSRPGYIVVEYRDEIAGYFWSEAIIEELLNAVIKGHRNLLLYDEPS